VIPVGLTDLWAAAGAILAAPPAARRVLMARLIDEADVARDWRARHGRPHPRLGDGTLMAAALACPRRRIAPADPAALAALACAALAVRRHLRRGAGKRAVAEYLGPQTTLAEAAMPEIKPRVALLDPVWERVCSEAQRAVTDEPLLGGLMHTALLHHPTMERALAARFALKLASAELGEQILREIADEAHAEAPWLGEAARADLVATFDRDPACHRYLQPILYFKGYQAVQAHRVAHWLWGQGRIDMAAFVQMRVSEVFGVDIHPGARLGKGIMIDHAHSIVIGETAVVGDNVSMLHSVTLGGTGKADGDRHPKIGDGVLIGAGAKVLGNIRIGACSRIAAGSVVLADVPACTTVAGVPARVVGEAGCAQPALTMNHRIEG
jgi:serine O-acetyltransferase